MFDQYLYPYTNQYNATDDLHISPQKPAKGPGKDHTDNRHHKGNYPDDDARIEDARIQEGKSESYGEGIDTCRHR